MLMYTIRYCNRIHLFSTTSPASVTPSRRISTSANPDSAQPSIYHTLLSLYLSPPAGQKAQYGPAISILTNHGSRLPASSTLDLIPETLPVKELEFYFKGRIRAASSIVNEGRVVAGLRRVEAAETEAKLLLGDGLGPGVGNQGRNRRFEVSEVRVCGVCHKRLGGSVISVFPE
jgi:Vam6/Vps39-like protein vacuolar protein sorting-associated protein 39